MTLRRDMKNALSELRQDYAHNEVRHEIADCDRAIAGGQNSSVELNGGTEADVLKELVGRREALAEEAIAIAERRVAARGRKNIRKPCG